MNKTINANKILQARLDAQNAVLAQDSQKALDALDRIQSAVAETAAWRQRATAVVEDWLREDSERVSTLQSLHQDPEAVGRIPEILKLAVREDMTKTVPAGWPMSLVLCALDGVDYEELTAEFSVTEVAAE
jgi:hypothetical protein